MSHERCAICGEPTLDDAALRCMLCGRLYHHDARDELAPRCGVLLPNPASKGC